MKFFKDSSGVKLWIEKIGENFWIHLRGRTIRLSHQELFQKASGEKIKKPILDNEQRKDGFLRASLPGKVLDIKIKKGDAVKKNSPLIVIEAMKIEHTLSASFDTQVSGVLVKEGEFVDFDQKLISFSSF